MAVDTYISTKKILEDYSMEQQKKLVLKVSPFTIIKGKLYKQGQDQFCVNVSMMMRFR